MTPELEIVEVSRIERIRSLRTLFGLQGVSTQALAALAVHAVPIRIPAGKQITSEGQPNNTVYVILEGELETGRGGKNLGVFGARSTVGALAMLARDPNGIRIVATRETVALALRGEDVLEVFEDHFDMMHGVMRALAREIIEARRALPPHAGFKPEVATVAEYPARSLDLVERLLSLRRMFGLGQSHLEALAELARTAREVRYPAGMRLWSVGDRAQHMLSLVCGVIKGETPNGMQFRFGPRDIVGSFDMAAEVPRWFDAVVERDVVALSHDYEISSDLWEDHPELGFDFMQLLALMLLSLREQLSDRRAVDAERTAS